MTTRSIDPSLWMRREDTLKSMLRTERDVLVVRRLAGRPPVAAWQLLEPHVSIQSLPAKANLCLYGEGRADRSPCQSSRNAAECNVSSGARRRSTPGTGAYLGQDAQTLHQNSSR